MAESSGGSGTAASYRTSQIKRRSTKAEVEARREALLEQLQFRFTVARSPVETLDIPDFLRRTPR